MLKFNCITGQFDEVGGGGSSSLFNSVTSQIAEIRPNTSHNQTDAAGTLGTATFLNGNGVRLITGAVAGGKISWFSAPDDAFCLPGIGQESRFNWATPMAKRIRFSFPTAFTSGSQFTYFSTTTDGHTPNQPGVGMKVDGVGNVYLLTHNGSLHTSSVVGTVDVTGDNIIHEYTWDLNGIGGCDFYLDGEKVTTVTTAPTTSPSGYTMAEMYNTDASSVEAYFFGFKVGLKKN